MIPEYRSAPVMLLLLLFPSLELSATAQSRINSWQDPNPAAQVVVPAPILKNDSLLRLDKLQPPPLLLPPARVGVGAYDPLVSAIEQRLGAPYAYGATGPYSFDCSGFVWSVFQGAGVLFERGSAREFWERFQPVTTGEEFKLGNLVFFNGLRHVGIVAGESGFYHASNTNGVTFSPFSDYWLERIDGFRRVPQRQTY